MYFVIGLVVSFLLLIGIPTSFETIGNVSTDGQEYGKRIADLQKTSNESLNKIGLELNALQSNFAQNQNEINTKLEKLGSTLVENQKRTEETSLMYTLAQVSGIFVAIIGGFVTTKLLSLSSEKKKLKGRIAEIDTKSEAKKPMVEYYQNIVDNISYSRAKRAITYFTNDLLSEPTLKEYSIEDLLQKFSESNRKPTDKYEEKTLRKEYEDIINRIKKELEGRKHRSVLDLQNTMVSRLSPNFAPEGEWELFNDSYEKLRIEDAENSHLNNLKSELNAELEAVVYPQKIVRGLLILFVFVNLGVIFPLLYYLWSPYVGTFASPLGVSAFLVGLLLTFYYFGYELVNELGEDKNSNPSKAKEGRV